MKKLQKKKKIEASRCWLLRFKERNNLYNMKVQSEALSADIEAPGRYPEDLMKIINTSVHMKQHIFSVDGTALYWKNKPCNAIRIS